MQSILSIDFTSEPAALAVVEIEGRSLKVLQHLEIAFSDLLKHGRVVNDPAPPLAPQVSDGGQASETPPPSQNSPANPGSANLGSANSGSANLGQLQPAGSIAPEYVGRLKQGLGSLNFPWTTAVVTLPVADYLSLNLDLPFGDSRQIEKIIDLEVQDRVPFEVSEFLVEHRTLGRTSDNRHDVHVSMVPKPLLQTVISLCRQAGVEPTIISTAASALESFFYFAPEYFKEDCAVVLVHDEFCYVAAHVEGRVRQDRILSRAMLAAEGSENELKALVGQLRATICAAEVRYRRPIERVYLVGDPTHARELQQVLGRTVEAIQASELIKSEGIPSIGALAAPFAQDVGAPPILTNFRVREFSYHLQLGELLSGIYRLVPYLAALLVCTGLLVASVYYSRERKLETVRERMLEQVRSMMPDLKLDPSMSVGDQIQNEITKIDHELEGLGSQSKYSPLDILKEVAALLPNRPNMWFRTLSIRGTRIKITGQAPEVSDVEAFGRALRNSQKIRFRVGEPNFTDARFGTGTGKEFTFDIAVRE